MAFLFLILQCNTVEAFLDKSSQESLKRIHEVHQMRCDVYFEKTRVKMIENYMRILREQEA